MEKLNDVYISLGSDIEDKFLHLQSAFLKIKDEIGNIMSFSEIYETPPFGFKSDTTFLNACIKIATKQSAEEVLLNLQKIERDLGRNTKTSDGNYESRIIDLDILFYNQLILNTQDLTIPHRDLKNRNFVLTPLVDIEKDLIDPLSNLTAEQLLANCKDTSEIYPSSFHFSL